MPASQYGPQDPLPKDATHFIHYEEYINLPQLKGGRAVEARHLSPIKELPGRIKQDTALPPHCPNKQLPKTTRHPRISTKKYILVPPYAPRLIIIYSKCQYLLSKINMHVHMYIYLTPTGLSR